VSYSEWGGELCIDAIYVGSDPERVDITDFLSDSVIGYANDRIAEDWQESAIDRAEYIMEDR
jgi:hypothetical protein